LRCRCFFMSCSFHNLRMRRVGRRLSCFTFVRFANSAS
jgi:hypothetical protein